MWLLASSDSASSTIYPLEGRIQVEKAADYQVLRGLSARVVRALDGGYLQIPPAVSSEYWYQGAET